MSKSYIIGVSGASAAYQLPLYIARLREHTQAKITAIVSDSATNFVPTAVLRPFTDRLIRCKDVSLDRPYHILVSPVEAHMLLVPASAGRIARMAAGLCLDVLDEVLLLNYGRVHVFPSMNSRMWRSAPTQRNIQTLINDGNHVHVHTGHAIELASGSEVEAPTLPPMSEWLSLIAHIEEQDAS